jgi:hypothetical protein
MDFKIIPMNKLPSEMKGLSPKEIEEERQLIRDTILTKTNAEIVKSDKEKKTLALLRALGSDLNINAFALNFRLTPGPNGKWNDDVEEANYLMSRVIERLSVDSPSDDPSALEFVLTSTMFSKKLYGECASTFKDRLGLVDDERDLMVLRNVVMNPFPSVGSCIRDLSEVFERVVKEEVAVSFEFRGAHIRIDNLPGLPGT